MGFFNPALLFFAFGGAIPIIIHLLHRQKFRRVRWAAMEFLLAALKKTQRRLRLENLLLLLIRILVMTLLALAIARPFFHETPLGALGESDTHHIFVIDNSASMAYTRGPQSVLDAARKAAEKLLEGISPGDPDRFSLVTLSSWPETVLKERNQKEHVRKAIQELRPSHYGTGVAATMLEVRGLLDATKNRDRSVYIFTDLQRTGWEFRDEEEARAFAELLKQISHRDHTRFFLVDVGKDDAINRAVVDLRADNRVVTTRRTTRLTADLHNFSPTPLPSIGVSLYVDDQLRETRQTVLPPNVTTSVTFEHSFAESGPHIVRAALDADYLEADDQRWLALNVKSATRGLLVDGEPKGSASQSETYTLALALDPSRQGLLFSVDVKTTDLFGADGLDAYDFLVLANVQSLAPEKVERIESFVRRGGGLLVTLGPRTDAVSFNRDFWNGGKGLSPAELVEVLGDEQNERRINKFAANHPMFSVFREKLRGAIYGFVFNRYYKVKDFEPERVLAALDDNFSSPLFLEKPFGEGRVVLMTSTIDYEWNAGIQAHPPFVPVVQCLCEHLATRPSNRRNLFVGDLFQMELPVEIYQPPFTLETPVEGSVTLPSSPPEQDEKFFRLYYPQREKSQDRKVLKNEGLRHAGKYKLTRNAAREEEKLVAWFAANMPPRSPAPEEINAAEGNLERIRPDEIRRRFPDFKVEFRSDEKAGAKGIDVSADASGGGLWKLLLYFLLGFILLESTLAWLFGRAKQ